jgi:hypothetical protein
MLPDAESAAGSVDSGMELAGELGQVIVSYGFQIPEAIVEDDAAVSLIEKGHAEHDCAHLGDQSPLFIGCHCPTPAAS